MIIVRITPKARLTKLTALKEGVFWVSVAAPPIEGRANEALIEFLSHCLKVPKSAIYIKIGESSRIKTIEIKGLERAEAENRLFRYLP